METCDWYDLACYLSWLIEDIKLIFLYVLDSILSGVASLIEAIPVPSFLQNVGSVSIPPTVLYFADPLELSYGTSVVVSAYTLRFVIRRLPVIG